MQVEFRTKKVYVSLGYKIFMNLILIEISRANWTYIDYESNVQKDLKRDVFKELLVVLSIL